MHHSIVIGATRQLLALTGIPLYEIDQSLQLRDLVKETDQVLFRHELH